MPRPRKRRRLWHEPQPAIFKPVGIPLRRLAQVTLLHEELEALRLADLEDRYQAEAAEQLGVSRSTFQRILVDARRKVVQALVDGAALHIEGGTFRVAAVAGSATSAAIAGRSSMAAGWGSRRAAPPAPARAIRRPPRNAPEH